MKTTFKIDDKCPISTPPKIVTMGHHIGNVKKRTLKEKAALDLK